MTNSDPLRRYVFVNKTLTRETTKVEFFRDEQAALEPFQPGLFGESTVKPSASAHITIPLAAADSIRVRKLEGQFRLINERRGSVRFSANGAGR